VQEEGCGALWYLGVNADNRVKIAKQGGIAAILKIMGLHKVEVELILILPLFISTYF
jgi:hypothetical protein